jgi:hypothetical protein
MACALGGAGGTKWEFRDWWKASIVRQSNMRLVVRGVIVNMISGGKAAGVCRMGEKKRGAQRCVMSTGVAHACAREKL